MLLTDVILPEMNGQELYQNIHAMYGNVKVLYISGYANDVIGAHGILDEGIHFLQKPFTIQDLLQKVRQALE